MVYFVQRVDGGRIKIGHSALLSKRLRTLEEQCGERLRVLAVMDGDRAGEEAIHGRFADSRAIGEWFEPTPELLAFIKAKGQPWNGEDEREARYHDMSFRLSEEARVILKRLETETGLKRSAIVEQALRAWASEVGLPSAQ